jgi:hypothetical protein
MVRNPRGRSGQVKYYCLWEVVYRAIGETPPPGAKPNIDVTKIEHWLRSLDSRELEIAGRLTGMQLTGVQFVTDPVLFERKPRSVG